MNGPLNILVAEDNADDLFLLQQAFKKAQVSSHLKAVEDGLDALAYLKGENAFADRVTYPFPDVLLLDLNMPRLNGFELLEALRQQQQFAHLVTYILTASCREPDVRRAYDLGAAGYTVKPTRIEELVAFVKALHDWHRFIQLPPRRGSTNTGPTPI